MHTQEIRAATAYLSRTTALLSLLLCLWPSSAGASTLTANVVVGAEGFTPNQVQQVSNTGFAQASLGGASGLGQAGFGVLRVFARPAG